MVIILHNRACWICSCGIHTGKMVKMIFANQYVEGVYIKYIKPLQIHNHKSFLTTRGGRLKCKIKDTFFRDLK